MIVVNIAAGLLELKSKFRSWSLKLPSAASESVPGSVTLSQPTVTLPSRRLGAESPSVAFARKSNVGTVALKTSDASLASSTLSGFASADDEPNALKMSLKLS